MDLITLNLSLLIQGEKDTAMIMIMLMIIIIMNRSCPKLIRPVRLRPPTSDVWQTVLVERAFVYSAFFDTREQPFVKIVTIVDNVNEAFCHFWYPGVRYPITVVAKLFFIKPQFKRE